MEIYNSPFNASFGEQSKCFIPRKSEFEEIRTVFSSDDPRTKVFLIGGPRGYGKTVLLSQLKEHFDISDDWVCVDFNPFLDMFEQLASKLYSEGKLKHLFLKSEFSISFKGISFSLSGKNPVTDASSLIKVILQYLKKKGKRVLITIDDISGNSEAKAFFQSYQSFIREKFDIFLLMTGLYENVSNIVNDKSLTFLLRTPNMYLSKLNVREISLSYQNQLGVDFDKALEFAKLTKGYAYAYQLLGDLLYRTDKKEITEEILQSFDSTLEDNVYNKIWSSLSKNQKKRYVMRYLH